MFQGIFILHLHTRMDSWVSEAPSCASLHLCPVPEYLNWVTSQEPLAAPWVDIVWGKLAT